MGKCDREEIPRWLCHCCCSKCFESGFWSTFSPMRWRSYKQDRQVELTLGAELLVLSRATAEAKWIRSLWSEAMNAKYTLETHDKWSAQVPVTTCLESKPVYDHIHGQLMIIKDKRDWPSKCSW